MSRSKLDILNQVGYLIVGITCICALLFFYGSYTREQRAAEQFEDFKQDLLIELEINYNVQSEILSNTWKSFYAAWQDNEGEINGELNLEQFKKVVDQSYGLRDPEFLFIDPYWKALQKKPDYLDRLTDEELTALVRFRESQKKVAQLYTSIFDDFKVIAQNYENPEILTEYFEKQGTLEKNAFLYNGYAPDQLAQIKSLLTETFTETDPKHLNRTDDTYPIPLNKDAAEEMDSTAVPRIKSKKTKK